MISLISFPINKILSFGSGCAKPGFPDVFVRISKYTGWIQTVIARDGQRQYV